MRRARDPPRARARAAGRVPSWNTRIWRLRTPPPGGSLTPGAACGRIDFQFNPKELSLTKAATWNRTPAKGAKSAGPPEYQGPQPSKLTVEMFFDASDTHDTSVVKTVEQLFACCVPTSETRQQRRASPPWVVFHWGGLTGFPGYVSQVQANYTLFTTSGGADPRRVPGDDGGDQRGHPGAEPDLGRPASPGACTG